MIDLGFTKEDAGLDSGNVTVMLGMLESIHDEAVDDIVMSQFAGTIGRAILQLRELQRLAYETMIEVEAERASGRGHQRLLHRKPQ